MNQRTCHGCETTGLIEFFNAVDVPANVGTLAASVDEAQSARTGTIQLVACPHCGLIQNHEFDVDVIGFEPGYEVSLFHTPTFRKYIQSVVDRLIAKHELPGKRLLEIGCGGGDFLRLICQQGSCDGVGVDPTIPKSKRETFAGGGSVQLIPGFFGREHFEHLGDFVCCLSVFEDIPRPLEFLRSLREAIGEREIDVYFEVFNGFRAIAENEVWSIHYEQCNYFSLETLVGLFERAGFEVSEAGACYQGDQYLFVDAKPAASQSFSHTQEHIGISKTVRTFGEIHSKSMLSWTERLQQWKRQGKTAVLWGSGGKGISFLTSLPDTDCIQCVVDVNPDRQGKFIPLSGHRIVAPEALKTLNPDAVIISNPLYKSEIGDSLATLGLQCEIVIA